MYIPSCAALFVGWWDLSRRKQKSCTYISVLFSLSLSLWKCLQWYKPQPPTHKSWALVFPGVGGKGATELCGFTSLAKINKQIKPAALCPLHLVVVLEQVIFKKRNVQSKWCGVATVMFIFYRSALGTGRGSAGQGTGFHEDGWSGGTKHRSPFRELRSFGARSRVYLCLTFHLRFRYHSGDWGGRAP